MDVKKHFRQSTEVNKYICLVETCNRVLKTGTVYNLKRHLQLCHKDIIDITEPPKKKIKKIQIAINKETYVESCVKLVTVNSLPFSFLDYEAFRLISEPIETAVGISINSGNVQNLVHDAAKKIRELIVKEIENKLVCLKIDIASKFDRTILTINLQYLCGNIIKIRTIGLIQLTNEHTGNSVQDEILKILNNFSIKMKQIYSTTVDNGANMRIEQTIELESANDILNSDINSENYMYTFADQLLPVNFNPIRCAAHTLQLAVHDAIKGSENEIQQLIEILKTDAYRNVFSVHGKRIPFLDCETRWNSCYDMIEFLIDKKEFILKLFSANDENNLCISDELWQFMYEFLETYRPVYVATKNLQEIQYSVGDFYKYWLECEIDLESNCSQMAVDLLACLNERKKNLMDHDAFLAAIYMDPRFNFAGSDFLTGQDKARATKLLMNTWESLKQVNKDIPAEIPVIESASSACIVKTEIGEPEQPSGQTLSRLELFLRSKNEDSKNPIINVPTIKRKIELLSQVNRLSADANTLDYWYQKQSEDMGLYLLSQTVLAVPSSQASIERAFSALGLISKQNESNMTDSNLNNVLIVKLNSDLLDSISLITE